MLIKILQLFRPNILFSPRPLTRPPLPLRDHSKILVGDGRGRVFSWSVSEQPGRSAADHWVKDEVVDSCSGCTVRFSLTERRHHCRNCGQLFCQKWDFHWHFRPFLKPSHFFLFVSALRLLTKLLFVLPSCRCSRFQSEIKRLKISSPVRVCQNCYYNLQHERSAEDSVKNWKGLLDLLLLLFLTPLEAPPSETRPVTALAVTSWLESQPHSRKRQQSRIKLMRTRRGGGQEKTPTASH